MSKTKILFEQEAKDFDYIIPLLIPFYNKIYEMLIETIPLPTQKTFKILDIGCGTGTLAKKLKENFPLSQITCLDFANNMIEIAKNKLSEYQNDIRFVIGDFNDIEFHDKYDVIVSCFALHHIPSDKEKIKTYQNIYRNLNKGGLFLTADIVLGTNNYTKHLYFEKWKNFMRQSFSNNIIEEELLPKYQAGDNPVELFSHLKWLEKSGFSDIETVWKYFNFAIWGGKKVEDLFAKSS